MRTISESASEHKESTARARVRGDTRETSTQAIALILDAVAPNAVTSVLVLVAGLLALFGVPAGLYVLVLPVLVALAGSVVSAWLLLTKIPQ
jgi:hypothetical protein